MPEIGGLWRNIPHEATRQEWDVWEKEQREIAFEGKMPTNENEQKIQAYLKNLLAQIPQREPQQTLTNERKLEQQAEQKVKRGHSLSL